MKIKKEDEDTSKPTVVTDRTGLAGKSARESPLKAASSSHHRYSFDFPRLAVAGIIANRSIAKSIKIFPAPRS